VVELTSTAEATGSVDLFVMHSAELSFGPEMGDFFCSAADATVDNDIETGTSAQKTAAQKASRIVEIPCINSARYVCGILPKFSSAQEPQRP
jgi:hypothetical protein